MGYMSIISEVKIDRVALYVFALFARLFIWFNISPIRT